MPKDTEKLVWLDLEMTGLDDQHDEILELATVITNKELELVAEGPVYVFYQPQDLLANMDEWNSRQHKQSGLLDKVRKSATTYAQAEAGTLGFLKQHLKPSTSPMCGNSICQDRRFLSRLMPDLEQFFHYRNLDVSTLKELVIYWGKLPKTNSKESKHRALNDIYDSIDEMKYYRSTVMRI